MGAGAAPQQTLRHGHHHGEPERRLDFGGFSVMRLRYPAHFADAPHRHQHAAIATPYDGLAYQRRDGREDARSVGMHRFHPEYELHAERVGPMGWSTMVVEMQPAWSAELRDRGAAFEGGFDLLDPDAQQLVRRIVSLLEDVPTPSASLRVQGLAYELIAALLDARDGPLPVRRPRWLARAREFIEETFRQRPGVDAIARAANVHPVHLARSFRRSYGETIGDYSRRLFLDEALRLLANAELSISEVAQLLGYTPSHFSAMLRARYGSSARELRRRLRGGASRG